MTEIVAQPALNQVARSIYDAGDVVIRTQSRLQFSSSCL